MRQPLAKDLITDPRKKSRDILEGPSLAKISKGTLVNGKTAVGRRVSLVRSPVGCPKIRRFCALRVGDSYYTCN